MKKISALFLTLIMILSLVACQSSTPTDETTKPAKVEGKTIEATLWTLTYDEDVWSYEAEDDYIDEEDYSYINMVIPGEDDTDYISAEIRVSVEDPGTFRDYLTSYGFDEYEYAVNNAYDFTKVAGVDCLKQEGNSWGSPCLRYFSRNEGAGATVFIEIVGEYGDERVNSLLNGLTIKLEDKGLEDGPWYWEGEAFSAEDKSAMAGKYTINSKWIPITDCIITKETFDNAVSVIDDKAYILNDGTLNLYDFDGKSLKFNKDLTTDEEFECINSDNNGNLWLSAFGEDLITMKNDKKTASYEDTDKVTMHPSGTWGISWFSNSECEKITIKGGIKSSETVNFKEVSTISHLFIDDNNIYITGSAADESGHKVFVYNKDCKLQKTLTDSEGEGLGSITFIAETKNGFIGLDGNMRTVILWNKDGKYIGEIEDSELFSTNYPWFCGGEKLDDGSILVIMTDERADESATELVAFKLSGF